ncbi:hypothetical protein SAMN05192574_103516 [Mucilaginibacter gossypiicola]|uniref:Uncharacterized protein n=1 Tax=Mucilaginibacter gossypiicola TaxID=551995 RepID=A0A1H8HI18_9SPHI|nr:hypothetical protein SAMN05192574_103516 [Mucilaginibacter gossypiicola]
MFFWLKFVKFGLEAVKNLLLNASHILLKNPMANRWPDLLF